MRITAATSCAAARGGVLIMSDWEHSLLSREKLDRSSPELWPEAIPGVTEYAARHSLTINNVPKEIEEIHYFDEEDYKLIEHYSTISKEALIQQVRMLHDLTYKLGLEESKEMTRGRFLAILPTKPPGRRK
ncbi:protein lin-52 homolog [Cimex lectularius]|uniref:Protein lin-52 homolog n=1 Tax=Cimex lectularius TaxID=79782 RepID=A0A8I6S6V6_CIMLE|nr:protein lin-52 homolog [Cimex lectularius]